jgi:hypothetical protein
MTSAMTSISLRQRIIRNWQLRTVTEFNRSFQGRSDDVFIATYPKSGTTWLQMIVFQILTDGDIGRFDHISRYAGFWEEDFVFRSVQPDYGSEPRVFKSHFAYQYLYHGSGRYIYGVRDGKDVAVSFYHHLLNYNGLECSFREYWPIFVSKGVGAFGLWFEHVRQFEENSMRLNLMLVKYEDLSRNLETSISRISEFLGVRLSAQQLRRAVRNCRFSYMKQHESKFDLVTRSSQDSGSRPQRMVPNQFLRRGQPGDWRQFLDAAQSEQFDRMLVQWLPDRRFDEYRSLRSASTDD